MRTPNFGFEKLLIRCPLLFDEAYPSHLARLAAQNVVGIEELLGIRQVEVSQFRDFGLGMGTYCRIMGIADPLQARIGRTLVAYFLHDRLTMPGLAKCSDATFSKMLRRYRRSGSFLRMCPDCFAEERKQWGFSIWHLSHQLPCTLVCTAHRVGLINVRLPEKFRLPTVSDTRGTPYKVGPYVKALADAESEVFRCCGTPDLRDRLASELRAAVFRETDGRLAALRVAAHLRTLIPLENELIGLFPPLFFENGLEDFHFLDARLVDSSLLSVLRGSLMLMSGSSALIR